jgi:glycine oxidase
VNAPDVIITGAGIIGVSIALELQGRGARVLVLDRGEPGRESSSAAAGMLSPADPETPPALRPLAFASAKLFPAYVEKLEGLAQMKVDFRRCGAIAFLEDASLGGVPVPAQYRPLGPEEIRQMEPALQAGDREAFFVQEDSVDPALLMQAALRAGTKSGVEIRGHTEVHQISSRGREVEVLTSSGSLMGRTVIDCRGAWSGAPVRPRKGQSLYLQPERADLLEHVINAFEVYLVPRSSGKILVGATVEDIGFDKTVEASVIGRLHRSAAALVPELATATITEHWAGLRPGTPDNLPIIGPTEIPGAFIATGHFRNGILLAPVTAQLVSDLIVGKPLGLDLSAFSPARFAAPAVG